MSHLVLAQTDGPHVLVGDIDHCAVDDDDYRHLSKSLRLRDGDRLTVSDGQGKWRTARFGPSIEPDGDVVELARPEPELCIGFALVKSAKPELIVQKLTELGIDRLLPFRADRSVVQWDADRATKAQQRLTRVAREAVMQSKGAWLPEVGAVSTLAELVSVHEGVLARADFGSETESPAGLFGAGVAAVLVVVGPEGGWSESEQSAVPRSVKLAKNVLRAETACIALGTLMASTRDQIG